MMETSEGRALRLDRKIRTRASGREYEHDESDDEGDVGRALHAHRMTHGATAAKQAFL